MHRSITIDRIMRLVGGDNNIGLCTRCGSEVSNVEPDARKYRCPECREMAVFGLDYLGILLSR